MHNTLSSAPKLSIQLYTVREFTDDAHFVDTMTRVAELGTDWMIYEQDDYPVSPFDSCEKCIERMRPVLAE